MELGDESKRVGEKEKEKEEKRVDEGDKGLKGRKRQRKDAGRNVGLRKH